MHVHVYILKCADGSYYIGHSDDVDKRLHQHQSGIFPGYTTSRRPVELVWVSEGVGRYEALAFEQQIKRWSRAKKEALIRGDWERVSQLARGKSSKKPDSTP